MELIAVAHGEIVLWIDEERQFPGFYNFFLDLEKFGKLLIFRKINSKKKKKIVNQNMLIVDV